MKRSRACANLMALESSWRTSASVNTNASASASASASATTFAAPPQPLKKKQKAFQCEASHPSALDRDLWRPTMHCRNYFLSEEIERALALNPAEDEEQEPQVDQIMEAATVTSTSEPDQLMVSTRGHQPSKSIVTHKPCFAMKPVNVTHTLEFEFELDLPSLLVLSLSSPK